MTRSLSLPALALSLVLGSAPMAYAQHAPQPPAAAVPADDIRAAQDVVRAQLAAFASDDADQAFSFASPSIRQMFGSAGQFLRMVRSAYPVVYRPASVLFLKPEMADDELVQPVHMTDQRGATWLALYRLQRQDDTRWRIGGCVLVPRAGTTT